MRFVFLKEKRDQCDTSNFICADSYTENSGGSVCKGDAGSPLTTPENDVIGLAISVKPIDYANGHKLYCTGPSYFTRLAKHKSFIDFYLGNDNYCVKS